MPNPSCNICKSEFPEFKLYGVPPRSGECPVCGGKPRHRSIFHFIEKIAPRTEILEVGPSAVTTRFLPRQEFMQGSRYTVIDVRTLKHHQNISAPHQAFAMDATKMTFSDASFDLLMANNLLNWIPNYMDAFAEFRRVLKPDGIAVLNVFRVGEKAAVKPQEYRKNHPAVTDEYIEMNGTEWFFGDNYLDELKYAGFHPAIFDYNAKVNESDRKQLGLKDYSEMIVVTQNRQTLDWVAERVSDRAKLVVR